MVVLLSILVLVQAIYVHLEVCGADGAATAASTAQATHNSKLNSKSPYWGAIVSNAATTALAASNASAVLFSDNLNCKTYQRLVDTVPHM